MQRPPSKNRVGIFLMIASSIFVSTGQLFWKISSEGDVIFLIGGFLLYLIGAVIMIAAYRFGSLSVLQPILSLNYVFALYLGNVVLKEIITTKKIVGVMIIILSVILIGGGDN